MLRQGFTKRLEGVHRLWDELADFDASLEAAALVHALQVLAELVDAANAYWIGCIRMSDGRSHDALRGWRPRAIQYLHTTPVNARFYQESAHELNAGRVDDSVRAQALMAGTFRAVLLRELVEPEWFDGPYYERAYRARGLADAAFVISPVNRDAESYFGFQRAAGRKLFSRDDLELLAYALRPLKAFQRRVMLSRGLLIAHTPLTPMEQRVVRLLLTELSEKEIAARLALGPRTAHSHITQIFRKFGVSGRPGLAALWFRQSS